MGRLFTVLTVAAATIVGAAAADLPTVDLGYAVHRATINETAQYYNFSYIRYAKPPVGNLRFKAPVALSTREKNTTVNDGQEGAICYQANPGWQAAEAPFIQAYLTGQSVANFTTTLNISSLPVGALQARGDGRSTEDCLKLSVYASKPTFDKCRSTNGTALAPVLVYLYGGGYTFGSIDSDGSPSGLFERLKETKNKDSGLVFVALNYRLGAFGFLAGPNFQVKGTANAGFWDQRLALEWVQKNIHLFGGDKTKVTVMGESAGGGSIMHQITAFGGDKKAPFKRAIPQSPGFYPVATNSRKESTYQAVLAATNTTSFDALQALPAATLQRANIQLVERAPFGSFFFGPAADGDFVPELPGLLLKHGRFSKDVQLLSAHNTFEGLIFTPPAAITTDGLRAGLTATLGITGQLLDLVTNTLYPPIFNGSQGYIDGISRYAVAVADVGFVCNTYYMQKALGTKNSTYGYLFSVPPGLHAQDLQYTFYNGQLTDRINQQNLSAPLAKVHQNYILNFVADGNPNGPGLPQFDTYGPGRNVQNQGPAGIKGVVDAEVVPARCDFWQDALFT